MTHFSLYNMVSRQNILADLKAFNEVQSSPEVKALQAKKDKNNQRITALSQKQGYQGFAGNLINQNEDLKNRNDRIGMKQANLTQQYMAKKRWGLPTEPKQ